MTISARTVLGTRKHIDTDLDASAETVPTSTILYALEADNSANTDDVFIKIYNASPTVGTTDPYFVFKIPGGEVLTFGFSGGVEGHTLTAIFLACVTEAGTAGTTSPTNDVKVTLLAN